MIAYHPYAPEVLEDPVPVYRRLRAERPACYVEEFDCWFLSRFADIWQLNTRVDALSSANGTTPGQLLVRDTPVNRSLASLDPPRHAQHRGLISPRFKPGAVKALEPRVRAFARDALDRNLRGGEIDVLRDYAAQIAIRTVCELGGLPPEQSDRMLGWVNAIFEREPGHRGTTERGQQASREMFVSLLELVKERRQDPAAATGLLKLLLGTDLEGGLSDADVASYLSLLLIGGTDTFPKALANTIARLDAHPDQKRAVAAGPERALDAFHEALRIDTPTQMLGRTLRVDVELEGETLRAGQKVMFLWASANRDEREFEEPDRFDVARRPPRILAFGCGPHLCLGMHVARLEARVALEEFLSRVRDYAVDHTRAAWLRTEFVRGFTTLPVKVELA